MAETLVQQLADVTARTSFHSLPAALVNESKPALLDSIGCARAATGKPEGRARIDCARIVGGTAPKATIMDDSRYGYPRFIGATKWAREEITRELDPESYITNDESVENFASVMALAGKTSD